MHLHCPNRNSIFSKVFKEFSKKIFWLNEGEGRYCGWIAQVFWFCNGNVTTFNEFSKKFFWLKEGEGRYCGWKSQWLRYFGFAMATLQLFPTSRKCKKFNYSLYTVPAEMLYFRKYLRNSQKTFFGWKMMKVAIVGETFKSSAILVL